jgi:polyisoprenyl-phosphate glycosyltransferase
VRKYSIVLPCFNEAENLKQLVDRFSMFLEEWDFELILVDNGSTDNTAEILDKLSKNNSVPWIKPHFLKKNIGYGHGLRQGLEVAEGEILAYTHADDQTPPEDVFRAFELFRSGELDPQKTMVRGKRAGREKAFLTTRGLSIVASMFIGLKVEDLNGQPKVFHRSLLKTMRRKVNNFAFDPYVLYCAKEEHLEIYDMEVEFMPRTSGESKSAHSTLAKLRTITGFVLEIMKFKS